MNAEGFEKAGKAVAVVVVAGIAYIFKRGYKKLFQK